jgi:hypothetical protein
LVEWLEDRIVPSTPDGTLLVANFPNPRVPSQPSFVGILGVNPATGAQFPISQGGSFSEPTYSCEAPNGQLYVSDLTATGQGAIIRVDPATGNNSVLASGGAINGPNVLAFVNGYIYVATEGPTASGIIHDFVKIDPNTGNQLQVFTGNFHVPSGMVPVPGQNAVYVSDEQGQYNTPPPLGRLWKVDWTTETQTLVSSNTSSQGMLFDHAVDVAVDPSGRIFVANTGDPSDNVTGSLFAVNPQTGVQSPIATFGNYSGTDSCEVAPNGQIHVGNISGSAPGNITIVDPATGSTSILVSGGSLSSVEGIRIYHATGQTTASATNVTSSTNPSVPGQSVTFTATVTASGSSSTPTGTVQFVIDGSSAGGPVSLTTTGGRTTATYTISSLAAGSHTITAVYSGDSNFPGSSGSLSGGQTVKQPSANATTTAVTSSANPSTPGQSISFTATVSASGGSGAPTGTVQFVIDGSNVSGSVSLVNAGGRTTASYTTSSLAVGTHTVSAIYSGDSNFASSSGSLSGGQTVNQPTATGTTTTVTSSASPAVSGESVTFTATVSASGGSGTPTGTVQFAIDGSNVGGPVSLISAGGRATATYSTTSLAVGTHAVIASYSGDSNFASSSGHLSGGQVVNQPTSAVTTTAVTSSANPSVFDQSIAFTATVSPIGGGTPTGTVQFVIDGSDAGALVSLNQGVATSGSFSSLSVGTHSIQAIYSGDSNFAGSTGSFTQIVNPVAATALIVAGFPTPTTAGSVGSVTVAAEDSTGNIVPGYRGTIYFSSSDSQASLPGTYTFTAADNGVHTFNVVFRTAGYQVLVASDIRNGGVNGSQSGILVTPAAADHLLLAPSVSTTTAGTPFDFAVTVQDAYNNTVTGYTGTVAFSSADPYGAGLPAAYTFKTADGGVHTFASGATLYTAGAWDVTAADTNNPGLTGSANVYVVPAAPDHFLITPSVSTSVAGTPFDVTVTVLDAYNNTVTGYTGTVAFSSADPYGADLPAAYTFTAADGGTHTFASSATLYTVGSWDITATDTGNSGLNGTTSVLVTPAAASHFLILAPSSAVAGSPFDITIEAVDPYGNVDTNYVTDPSGVVHFSTTDPDPGVVLPPDFQFTVDNQGVITFAGGVTLITPADQTLMAIDTASGLTDDGSAVVTITAPGGGAAAVGIPPIAAFGQARAVPTTAVLSSTQEGTAPAKASLVDQVFETGTSQGRDGGSSFAPASAEASLASASLQAIDSVFSSNGNLLPG